MTYETESDVGQPVRQHFEFESLDLGTLELTYDTDSDDWARERAEAIHGRIISDFRKRHPILSLFYDLEIVIQEIADGSKKPKSKIMAKLRKFAKKNPVAAAILAGSMSVAAQQSSKKRPRIFTTSRKKKCKR